MNLEKINKLVKESGLKQIFIAKRMGLSSGQDISHRLHGRTRFKVEELKVLAEIFNVDVNELIN